LEKHDKVEAGSNSRKNQTTYFMQKLEYWPIDRLIEYARNPRKNDHAVDRVASVIHEFGFRVPILAKSDGSVIDGHLRIKAARKLKLEDVPVIICDDMTETQIKAFRLSVNKVAELADWDDELLGLELADLREADFDLDLTGFDGDEIEAALNPDGPDFEPGTEGDQGKLDEKSPIECPHCHKFFTT
jgi:ParB-like chromosome segregation protein Spo0J